MHSKSLCHICAQLHACISHHMHLRAVFYGLQVVITCSTTQLCAYKSLCNVCVQFYVHCVSVYSVCAQLNVNKGHNVVLAGSVLGITSRSMVFARSCMRILVIIWCLAQLSMQSESIYSICALFL